MVQTLLRLQIVAFQPMLEGQHSKLQVSVAFKSGPTIYVTVYATTEEAVYTSFSTYYHLYVLLHFLQFGIYLGKVGFQNKIHGK